MSQVNYDSMSLDRINQRPLRIIASPDDPDFDEKVQAAIRQKLEVARSNITLKNYLYRIRDITRWLGCFTPYNEEVVRQLS